MPPAEPPPDVLRHDHFDRVEILAPRAHPVDAAVGPAAQAGHPDPAAHIGIFGVRDHEVGAGVFPGADVAELRTDLFHCVSVLPRADCVAGIRAGRGSDREKAVGEIGLRPPRSRSVALDEAAVEILVCEQR